MSDASAATSAVREVVTTWRDRELTDAGAHDRAGGLPDTVLASAAAIDLPGMASDAEAGPVAARAVGAVGLGHAVALVVAPANGGVVTLGGMSLGDGRAVDGSSSWLGLRVAAPSRHTDTTPPDHRTATLLLHALVGLTGRLDELARGYAADREAFGRPIRRFQTVAHRLVDIRAVHREVAALADASTPTTAVTDLGAAARRTWSMVDDVLQVHGGIGYAEEHEVARHWRDVRMLRLLVEPAAPTGDTPPPRSATADPARLAARAAVTRILSDHATAWERDGDWPREVFTAMADAGGLGSLFDEADGGTGTGMRDRAVWVEEMARGGSGGLSADLGASVDLAALYVARAGDDAQRKRWLPGLLSGELVGALGITEPGAGSDVAGITTRARRDGDDWVLDGAKVFITNGPWADVVVTAAKVGPEDGGGDAAHGQITLFAVPGDTDGLTRRRLSMLGWRTSHTGELHYDGVRVPDTARLGDVGSGFSWIVQNFAWERLTLALGAIVSNEDALDGIPVPARDRRWHHLDGRTRAARALVDRALTATVANAHGGETLELVALAKLQTQTLAVETADLALAVVGVDGGHLDNLAQRRLRDARLGPIGGGTDAIMREIVAKVLP